MSPKLLIIFIIILLGAMAFGKIIILNGGSYEVEPPETPPEIVKDLKDLAKLGAATAFAVEIIQSDWCNEDRNTNNSAKTMVNYNLTQLSKTIRQITNVGFAAGAEQVAALIKSLDIPIECLEKKIEGGKKHSCSNYILKCLKKWQ